LLRKNMHISHHFFLNKVLLKVHDLKYSRASKGKQQIPPGKESTQDC
jgi:hypothetical protein